MNGIQIEHILNVVEDRSAYNRAAIRREVGEYLRANIDTVVAALASSGKITIKTSYGDIDLTKTELESVTA